MHLHIPKPLHGWREFAGEVGIIVVGVLIALGAEQLVEMVHWRFETDAAREALRSEAASALGSALFRQQQQPCVDRRLRELATIFADHAAGRPIALRAEVARPIPYGATLDAWQIELSSQALSHMSLTDRLRFSEAFGSYDHFNEVLFREQDAWSKLRALDQPDQLQDGDWPILRQAYGEAFSLSNRLRLITDNVLSKKTLGERPRVEVPPRIAAEVAQICQPITAKQ